MKQRSATLILLLACGASLISCDSDSSKPGLEYPGVPEVRVDEQGCITHFQDEKTGEFYPTISEEIEKRPPGDHIFPGGIMDSEGRVTHLRDEKTGEYYPLTKEEIRLLDAERKNSTFDPYRFHGRPRD